MSDVLCGSGPALALERITVRLGGRARPVVALDDVTLSAPAGAVTGLVGPDGAGKTTLMRVAAGLLDPERGTVRVLGEDIGRNPDRIAAHVGYMPQRFGLYEDLTVAENLDLYGDLNGVPRRERAQRLEALLHMTGLAPFLRRLAGKLSGGMKQKLGLACALLRAPRLLLLDEPTVGVDPVSRRELWVIIGRLVRDQGTGVLVSTAYLDETAHCDNVYVLDAGHVVDAGRPGALTERMAGRVFVLGPSRESLRAQAVGAAASGAVLDAVPERGRVRIVTRTAAGPASPPAGEPAEIPGPCEPVPPRFEDYFVGALAGPRAGPAGSSQALPGSGSRPYGSGGEAVIEVDGVWRRFGEFAAVKNVGFTVRRGEIFGLLGANGAGKSTLFRMLCGLLPASAGRLRVAGEDMRRAPAAARARLGYVAQRFSLYAGLTVAQNLRFFAAAYGLAGRRRSEAVRRVMETFQLLEHADTDGADLPLGFRQRLALAGALMHDPEILFLDEATSGVDPLARREFWRRINALAAQGVTVLVTTHFMEEAEQCDRLVIMDAGAVLAQGTPDAIRALARTPGDAEPTMEDAFVALLGAGSGARAA